MALSLYDHRFLRARSALPESLYEDAYNRSESSRLRRAVSSVRESSSSYSRVVNVPIPALIKPYPIVVREVERPRRSYLSNYLDYFRHHDALARTKITIRYRDNYWHDKYVRDIVNAKPNVYVVRPRYIVQRPIHIHRAPTPPPQPIIVPRYIYVKPRVREEVRTVRRITRYVPPVHHYLTHQYVDSSDYSSSSSSSSSSARYSANNYLTY